MKFPLRSVLAIGAIALAACSSKSDTPRAEQYRSDPPQKQSGQPGASFMVAGFEFHAPEGWVPVPLTSDMRKASFEYGPVGNDTEKAEMHCYFFGPGQGGDVESNIQRWLGQVSLAEGQEPARESFSAAGYPVHVVSASGTYAMSMGGPMSGRTEAKAGWRLVGGIVEGAQGNVFFRLAGPEATVRAMEPGFRAMLEGLSMGRE